MKDSSSCFQDFNLMHGRKKPTQKQAQLFTRKFAINSAKNETNENKNESRNMERYYVPVLLHRQKTF
jgi:hypothetical protein